jgi:hypothetical protein
VWLEGLGKLGGGEKKKKKKKKKKMKKSGKEIAKYRLK